MWREEGLYTIVFMNAMFIINGVNKVQEMNIDILYLKNDC